MQSFLDSKNQAATQMLLLQACWIVAVGLLLVLCLITNVNLAVPFVLLISAWFFKVGMQGLADSRAVEHCLDSDSTNSDFKNGQWVAVQGRLRLLVPGTDRALPNVVAYYFRVFDLEKGVNRRSSGSSTKRTATRRFDGFYLVPTGISTNNGIVKLGGFPDLTALEKNSVPEEILVRGESQAEIGSLWLPTYLQRIRLVSGIEDHADTVIKYGDRHREGDHSGEYMGLHRGDEVCVLGRWQNGSLIADKRRPRGLPVYQQPAEKVAREVKANSHAFNAAGVFFLAIAIGLIGWSLWSA